MSLTERFLIWIISFLILSCLMFVAYKVSYKLGIKKALYRTTYILLSVIFAFVLAPFVNDLVFDMDLRDIGIMLKYKNNEFYTLIDYIEEVIVHSNFLNDLYVYFPSLKDMLMDFPQILLVPLIYVFLFIAFLIVWFPLYLYLSYKRKRRILYEREDNKRHRIWAGILGCVQVVFLVSATLSPLNGLSRIYRNATKDTLSKEYDSLCDEHDALTKYKQYCDIIEVYNSTVFATIGGNKSISNHIFDSLTRMSYDGGYTSLSDEASMIVKSGIVLNQSGLIESISSNSDTLSLDTMIEGKLSEEDIDVIVETLSESKYSENVLRELENLVNNTLNGLMKDLLGNADFDVSYVQDKDEMINEIKLGLKTINLLANSTLISDLVKVIEKIIYFANVHPNNRKTDIVVMEFFNDVTSSINLKELEQFGDYMFDSRIFENVMPYLLDELLGPFGFRFIKNQGDIKTLFHKALEFFGLIDKYHPYDFFEFLRYVSDEELMAMADIVDYICKTPEIKGLLICLLNEIFRQTNIEYFPHDFLEVKNWRKEAYVLRDFCIVIEKAVRHNVVDTDGIIRLLKKYKDSEMISIMKNIAVSNINFFAREIILAIGK